MKILFVEQSELLQAKWIEPLRKKGWGVVRARSAEDATRMMSFHGDSLEAIAVGEKFVAWGEKQQLPFVVLNHAWSENDILKHQNSDHSAIAYLSLDRGVEEIYNLFEANTGVLKATGTDGVPIPGVKSSPRVTSVPQPSSKSQAKDSLSLEDYSQILVKPEVTMTQGSISLQLTAPTVVLGGQSAKKDVEAVSFDTPLNEFNPDHNENRTVLLDATKIPSETNVLSQAPSLSSLDDFPEGESLDSLDDLVFDDPPPPPVQLRSQAKPVAAPKAEKPKFELPAYEPEPEYEPAPATAAPLANYSVPVNQFSVDPAPRAQITDSETLRSYLALREQDVAVLSGQVRSSQERIQQLEMQVKVEKARNAELTQMVTRQEQQINNYNREKQVEMDVLHRNIEDLDTQLKDRTDKARAIEAKLRMTMDEVGKVKERVRVDIRRIRVREKELESQLEVLKKDSSALLQARDEKILELKRKLDLLEFNMELVQEQFSKEKQTSDELKTKLKDAAQVMKQAGGMLEQ